MEELNHQMYGPCSATGRLVCLVCRVFCVYSWGALTKNGCVSSAIELCWIDHSEVGELTKKWRSTEFESYLPTWDLADQMQVFKSINVKFGILSTLGCSKIGGGGGGMGMSAWPNLVWTSGVSKSIGDTLHKRVALHFQVVHGYCWGVGQQRAPGSTKMPPTLIDWKKTTGKHPHGYIPFV